MSSTTAVILVIVMQQALFAVLWAVMALLRMARPTTLAWMAAALLMCAGMPLVALRDQVSPWLGYWWGNVCIFVGLLLVRRGIAVFARRPAADPGSALAILAFACAMGLATQDGRAWVTVIVNAVALAWLLADMARLVDRHLGAEFGQRIARGCAAPFALIAALFLVRGVWALVESDAAGASLHVPSVVNVTTALALMLGDMLINIALIALVLTRVLTRLQHLSEHDSLTGLLIRRAIEQRLAEEANRLARYHQPYSVLSIDIDHFKHVNDRYGHPAGDRVLFEVAQTLQRMGRVSDRAARAGGEEFWLLMPGTALDGAHQVAERTLAAVRELRFPDLAPELRLTLSIGVAVADDPAEPHADLMHRLDAALYRAKQGGRDRIELAPPPARLSPGDEPALA